MGLRDRLAAALVSSAMPVSATGRDRVNDDKGKVGGGKREWQEAAFYFYDRVGEVNYVSRFYERPMSAVILRPEYLTDNNEWVDPLDLEPGERPAETDQVMQAWANFQDRTGGRSTLQGSYGKLAFLNGEKWLANLWDDDLGLGYWTIMSRFELRPISKGRWKWFKGDNESDATELTEPEDGQPVAKGQVKAYKLWTPHPKYHTQPDAPMRAVLDFCENLLTALYSIRATSRSRLNKAGILYVNKKILPPAPGLQPGEQHPWIKSITDAIVTPIQDPDDASANAPIVLTGGEDADKVFKHISFAEALEYPEIELVEHLISRMAHALDMPAEFLLGLASANHWTGWLLDEQAWSHVSPVVERMCLDFTTVYLRPLVTETLRDRWRIGNDPTPAVTNPDSGKNAKDLHDRGALSDLALLAANGFEKDDLPADNDGTGNSNPKVKGGVDPNTGQVGTGDEPAAAPEAPPAEDDTEGATLIHAAQVALYRCRETAGSRIRSKLGRHPALLREIHGAPADAVAAILGPEKVISALNGKSDPHMLVSGGSTCFKGAMEDVLSHAQIAHYRNVIEEYAADTLFEERPSGVPI